MVSDEKTVSLKSQKLTETGAYKGDDSESVQCQQVVVLRQYWGNTEMIVSARDTVNPLGASEKCFVNSK